jgi:hypothetical protein
MLLRNSGNIVRILSPLADPPIASYLQGYSMNIDVEPVYTTGSMYSLRIVWDPFNNTWSRTLNEVAMLSSFHGATGGTKEIQVTNNYTGFFKDNYITLPLDSRSLNYPSKYRLAFIADDAFIKDRHFCSLFDSTNFVSIPPPQINITSSPNSLELRPGEQKSVELEIKSEPNTEVRFSSRQK